MSNANDQDRTGPNREFEKGLLRGLGTIASIGLVFLMMVFCGCAGCVAWVDQTRPPDPPPTINKSKNINRHMN